MSAEYLQIVTNNQAYRYCFKTSITGILFKVKSVKTHHNYIVNLLQYICTCLIWQSSGYPYSHAISIILAQKEDPQHYVKPFFTIAAY